MKFTETKIPGVYVVEIERLEDVRGFFARTWDEKEATERGLEGRMVQCSTGFNREAGTLRGMHFQTSPHAEAKVVRCTRGAIYDVVLDLRPDSPMYTKWITYELTGDNHREMYIPKGCAHGYQTLSDSTEVLYMMSEYFHPDASSGVRYDDPAFNIGWPETATRVISERDRNWPDWKTV